MAKTKAAPRECTVPGEFILRIYWKKGAPVGRYKPESRICFGLMYFTVEKDADRFAKLVEKAGDTYNGGWYHGAPCGRDNSFDHTDQEGVRWYAVTTA
jgi:hypothetical protein